MSSNVPALSSSEARQVDRHCAERLHLPVSWLMEAAGWQLARSCRRPTAVVCGTGNNGGDGLAAARHLHGWGRLTAVSCTDRGRLAGDAAGQAQALEALGVSISAELDLAGADCVLDALLGTGLSREPEGRAAQWIEAMNASGRAIVAADIPSGLDADTGQAFAHCVIASRTVTLGLPKLGLLAGDGPRACGELWVADIGIPREAYAATGVSVGTDLFAEADIFRLNP